MMTPEQQIKHLEARLNGYATEITKLEGQSKYADTKLRETYEHEINDLRQRRRRIEQQLANARLKKAESWSDENLGAGIMEALDEIGQRLNRLLAKVK